MMAEIITGVTVIIGAMVSLLTVLLVQGRKAKADAAYRSAEAEHLHAETWKMIRQLQGDSEIIRENVANTHSTNMRVDLDDVRNQIACVKSLLDERERQDNDLLQEIKGVREEVRQIRDDAAEDRREQRFLNQTAYKEHELLHKRINEIKDELRLSRKRVG